MSVRYVEKHIKELKELGLIERIVYLSGDRFRVQPRMTKDGTALLFVLCHDLFCR